MQRHNKKEIEAEKFDSSVNSTLVESFIFCLMLSTNVYVYSIVGIEYTPTLNEISPNERSLIQKGDKTSIC